MSNPPPKAPEALADKPEVSQDIPTKRERFRKYNLASYAGTSSALAAAGLLGVAPPLTLGAAGVLAGTYLGTRVAEKTVIPAASSFFWDFLNAGDPEAKVGLGGFLNKVIKRGEGDIPKEFKTVLDIYKTSVDIGTKIPEAAVGLGSIAVMLTQAGYAKYDGWKTKKEKTRTDFLKEQADKLAADLDAEQQYEDFMLNGADGEVMTDAQQEMIQRMFNFGPPIPPATANPFVALFNQNPNFFRWMNINPTQDDQVNEDGIADSIKFRTSIDTKLYNLLPDTLDKNAAETKLRDIQVFLYNTQNTGGLTEQERAGIQGIVGANRIQIDKLNREIETILLDLEDPLVEWVDVKNEISTAASLANNINALANPRRAEVISAMQEAWLSGAAFNMVGIDDNVAMARNLPPELNQQFLDLGFRQDGRNSYNPIIFTGFTNIPEPADVQTELTRLNAVDETQFNEQNLRPKLVQLEVVVKPKEIIGRNFRTMSKLSPLDVNNLNKINNTREVIKAGVPVTIESFGGAPTFTTADQPFVIQLQNLLERRPIQGMVDVESFRGDVQNLYDLVDNGTLLAGLAERTEALQYLEELGRFSAKFILENDVIFGTDDPVEKNNSILTTIEVLNAPRIGTTYNIDFAMIYEGLGGDFTLMLNGDGAEDIKIIASQLRGKISTKKDALRKLLVVLGDTDQSSQLRAAHLQHLKQIVNGEIIIESNLKKGRDHNGFINQVIDIVDALEVQDTTPPFDFNQTALREILFPKSTYAPNGDDEDINLENITIPKKKDGEKYTVADMQGTEVEMKLKPELTDLYARTMQRIRDLQMAYQNTDPSEDVQKEFLVLRNLRKTLERLGIYEKRESNAMGIPIYDINTRVLMMYLNGYNLSNVGTGLSNFEENLTTPGSPFGLKTGKKVTIP